jgi:hypothetical protein
LLFVFGSYFSSYTYWAILRTKSFLDPAIHFIRYNLHWVHCTRSRQCPTMHILDLPSVCMGSGLDGIWHPFLVRIQALL